MSPSPGTESFVIAFSEFQGPPLALSLSLSHSVSSSTQFDDGPNRDQTLPFLKKKPFKEPNRTRSPALLTAHANLPRLKLTGERASTQVGLLRTYATDADGAADGPGPQCLGK